VELPSCAAGVPIFQVLPEEGLEELSAAMRHRHFARGEVVIATGQPVEYLVVIARGRLKVVHSTPGGREQVVRALGPGEFIGEMALFAPARQEGDLVASEESDCCMVPRQAVQAILQRHPAVALRLVEALAQRLSGAEQLIADLGLRDVGQRLAAELLRLAGHVAERPPAGSGAGAGPRSEGVRVTVPMPWAEMAVHLGTTPESLSRRLKALADQGLIRQEETRTVLILNLPRLRRMAEG